MPALRNRNATGRARRPARSLVGRDAATAPRMFVGLGGLPGAPLFAPGDGAMYTGSGNVLGCQARAMSAVRAANGDILVFSQWNSDVTLDQSSCVISMSRSTDNGRTFSAPVKVAVESDPTNFTIGNACPVVQTTTGRIILANYRNHRSAPSAANNSIWVRTSDDHGATWSAAVNITSQVRVGGGGTTPGGHTWPASDWLQTIIGPHAGCCIESGAHAGRVLISAYHRLTVDGVGTPWPHAMYSDDGGDTWQLSNGTHAAANDNQIEPAILVLADGRILMNCRNYAGGSNQRKQLISTDGGANFADAVVMAGSGLPAGAGSNGCQGSIARLGSRLLLACGDFASFRHRLGIWQSLDEGANWALKRIVTEGWAAYSALIPLSGSEVLLLFEGGHSGNGSSNQSWAANIYAAYINLDWLKSTAPPQYVHHYNERAAGLAPIKGEATATIQAMSLVDAGPTSRINHNRRAQPRTDAAQAAYAASKDSGQTALSLGAGNDHIALSQSDGTSATFSHMPAASEEFTYEIILTPNNGLVSAAIFRTASSGKRITLDITAAGKAEVRFDRGTGAVQGTDYQILTSAASINDGATHHLAIRRKSPGTMELVTDGVVQSIADPSWATDMRTATEVRVGADHSNGSQFQGSIEADRLTKGYVSDGNLWNAGRVKTTPPQPSTFANPLLTDIANLKLWIPTDEPELWWGDWYATTPRSRANGDKIGVASCYEQALGAHFRAYRGSAMSPSRAPILVRDATLGWVYEVQNEPTPAHNLGSPLGRPNNTDLDWITYGGATPHTNPAFTIGLGVYVTASNGSSQVLIDNAATSAANPGFTCFINNANPANLVFQIHRDGAAVYAQTHTGALPYAQWHMILIRSAGGGANVEWFVRRIDTNTTPGSATVRGTSPPSGGTTRNSTQALAIGGSLGTWNPPGAAGTQSFTLNGRISLPFVANSALTDQQVADYFTRLKNGPSRLTL